jgi:two-component system response regulator MprA
VSAVGTGADALAAVEERPADLFVIDIGLPDADGRDLCHALRARGIGVPVLFLTARATLTDRLSGFTAGGDDYLTKPFSLAELAFRVRALARRVGAAEAPDDRGLRLDPVAHTIRDGDAAIRLTPTEFRILAELLARRGRTVRREELVAAAWSHGAAVSDNTLDVYVSRIRRKLAGLPHAPAVATVRGVGYGAE